MQGLRQAPQLPAAGNESQMTDIWPPATSTPSQLIPLACVGSHIRKDSWV